MANKDINQVQKRQETRAYSRQHIPFALYPRLPGLDNRFTSNHPPLQRIIPPNLRRQLLTEPLTGIIAFHRRRRRRQNRLDTDTNRARVGIRLHGIHRLVDILIRPKDPRLA